MTSQYAPKLLVIVGETASGKSALAIELAKRLNGEIINADSQTIRREANIGTAKPSISEQKAVKHHLIDIIRPDEQFSVAAFQEMANKAVQDISNRGKLPIMVGGTGLYIDSVIYNYKFGGNQSDKELRPNTLVIGIQQEREKLKQQVFDRTKRMINVGLEEEVTQLAKNYGWDCDALRSIGYREWQENIKDKNADISLEDVEAKINKDTLELAKKQRTWFKRNKSIHWLLAPVSLDDAVDLATTFLQN